MIEIIEKYLLLFFIYSFLGWLMETVMGVIQTKKLVNRGFLIGPYCPIYGVGVCLLTALLSKYVNDIPILFFMSILICGSLEYFTSYIMEKIFKARWWDYHNRKFNINGRICLETLIPFGIAGVVLVKFVNSFFLQLLEFAALKWILLALCIIFVIDFIFSLRTILKFRNETKDVEKTVKDDTEEISLKVKEIVSTKYTELKESVTIKAMELEKATNKTIEDIKNRILTKQLEQKDKNKYIIDKLKNKSWSTKRLINAFPNLEIKLKEKKQNKSKK